MLIETFASAPIEAIRVAMANGKGLADYSNGQSLPNWCQDPGWLIAIAEAYRLPNRAFVLKDSNGAIKGWLGAVLVGNALLGRRWVSMPFMDYGGPWADSVTGRGALNQALIKFASERKLGSEIRMNVPIPGSQGPNQEKVSMLLDLNQADYSAWWKSLDAKVRNQVRKAEKSAVTMRWGGLDQLDDFYRVFTVNMRDLGSPVHSKGFFESVFKYVPQCEIGTAWRERRCIGGLFRVTSGSTMAIPWASTLREERVHCPNNALYHASIETAFQRGLKCVDFGRSTKDEGTYRFKLQWMASEGELPWYRFDASGHPESAITHLGKGGMSKVAALWSRLPLGIANRLGPIIRKDIAA